MNPLQAAQTAGFRALLATAGRDLTTDAGLPLRALVEDIAPIADPVELARSKTPVYVNVRCVAGDISNPRTVQKFTEVGGRWFKVLKFNESSGNTWEWSWACEAQRQ